MFNISSNKQIQSLGKMPNLHITYNANGWMIQDGEFCNSSIIIDMMDLHTQLHKIQIQALLVSVQSFVDQFSIKNLHQVHSYIDMKDPKMFPDKVKQQVKNQFETIFKGGFDS